LRHSERYGYPDEKACRIERQKIDFDSYVDFSNIGIDLLLIEGKHFKAECLPPVESTDLLFYLVLETSFYTQQQFKAFRSLEAYNQMVSGFIASTASVQGHIIADKFVVLAKVRHSQRMNDSLIPIWISTETEGKKFCPLTVEVVRLAYQNHTRT